MKKFVSLALALILTLALSVTAFAALPAAETKTIAITKVTGADVHGYAAVITWSAEAYAFEYTSNGRQWNTDTLKWDTLQNATWTATSGTVTVANKSSKGISASVTSSNTAAITVTAPETEAITGGVKAIIGDAQEGAAIEKVFTFTVTEDFEPTEAVNVSITVTLASLPE